MANTQRPPKWVSADFLAGHYGVHISTIWRWSKNGLIKPPQKIGPNTSRFDFEAIAAGEPQQLELPGF